MSHLQTRRTRFLIASLVLVATIGCNDSSGPGEPEDPGVLIISPGERVAGNNLIWTRDGTEVIYINAGIRAVNVATHTVRQVDPSLASVLSSAGDRIYFGAFLPTAGLNDPNFRASRVHLTSGAVEILATTFLGSNDFVLVSADERFLVVNRGLYDLQTGLQTNLPSGQPVGFSPDGTKLLYYLDVVGTSTTSPALISTADGSSQQLHSTGYFHLAHRWEGNSPQLLRTDMELTGRNTYTVRLSEIDGLTGATRDIAQFSTTSAYYFNTNWSPDGRALATWVRQGPLAEKGDRTNLYVIRSGSPPSLVASITPPLEGGPPGRPVFSPDGSSLVYVYYHPNNRSSLYMKSGL